MHETSGLPARVALRDVATPGDNSASSRGLSGNGGPFLFYRECGIDDRI